MKNPYPFILEELEDEAFLKPMFGCLGVYFRGLLVLVITEDDIWVPTTSDHHKSLLRDFQLIKMDRPRVPPQWLVLKSSLSDFEEQIVLICEKIKAGDLRIGRPPSK